MMHAECEAEIVASDETARAVVCHAREKLKCELSGKLDREFYYASLPLCVIDAVHSLGVRYESVRAVVGNWCEFQTPAWGHYKSDGKPERSMADFLSAIPRTATGEIDLEKLKREIFRNNHRVYGSLDAPFKAEAVVRFAEVLAAHGIQRFSDLAKTDDLAAAKSEIIKFPGQRSGLSFRYFQMLAGNDDFVKGDRMVIRFVQDASGRKSMSSREAESAVKKAAVNLKSKYPAMTARLLDNLIWRYQRKQPNSDQTPRSAAG